VIDTRNRWAILVWLAIVAGVIALPNSQLMLPTPPIWVRTLLPVLLLFGIASEFKSAADYRLRVATIGAWLFALLVFLWNFLPMEPHRHPSYELPNAAAQLVFGIFTVSWAHWRARLVHRKQASAQV